MAYNLSGSAVNRAALLFSMSCSSIWPVFLPLLNHTPTAFGRDSLFYFWVKLLCSSQRSYISTLVPTACLFESQRFLKAKIGKWIENIELQFHTVGAICIGWILFRENLFSHCSTLKYPNLCALFNINSNWCSTSTAAVINASLTMDLNSFFSYLFALLHSELNKSLHFSRGSMNLRNTLQND